MRKALWMGSIFLVTLAGCSGTVAHDGGTGAGPSGSGGASGSTASSGETSGSGTGGGCNDRTPAKHRPVAVTCSPSPPVTCTQDVDCTDQFLDGPCVDGACAGTDQCMADSDCPGTTDVCSCYPQTLVMGGVSYGNACVSGNCHTDADCGPGGFCSPTVDSQCGGFRGVQGYYCHTCEDTCVDDADCGDGQPGSPYCAYDPTVGHWACETGLCAG